MKVGGWFSGSHPSAPLRPLRERDAIGLIEREFFIDNLLVQIHFVIEMILVDRPRAMGALNSLFRAALYLPS